MRQQKSRLKQKYSECDVVTIDCSRDDPAQLLEALDTQDLFSGQKLILAEHASFLSAKNTTKIDPAELLKRKETEHILILSVDSEKLDRRKKAVKELEKAATLVPCLPLDGPSQKQYVRERMKEKDLHLDPQALDWFCSHAGMDPMILDSELEKLSVFSSHPTLEDVQALTTVEPVDNIFIMTEALFARNGLRLLSAYRNFRDQNMEPLAVVMLLAGQIRFLFQVRTLMDDGLDKQGIAKLLVAHPYRTQKAMENARRFDADSLMDILEQLADLEQAMKSGRTDKDQGFEMFCVSLLED